MLVSYKTEINPTEEQKVKINKAIGTCRFIYNFYLATQKDRYEKGEKFQSAYDFSKWLNNDFIPNNPNYAWIKETSSKAIKQSIINAHNSYLRFFKGKSNFPKFKKKSKSNVKMHFVKTNAKATIWCERHRIKIPTLGWIKLKEKGYIPTTKSDRVIRSGTISKKADRYYVSVLVDVPDVEVEKSTGQGIGIDLGIKELAVVSNEKVYKNINKTSTVKKLEKKLKREQRKLSRKYKKLKKGETTQKNIQKQKLKVQKIHLRISNVRVDYTNKVISEIVKTKPSYITIEDLNVSGMMKNKHLSKAISSQKFYEFKAKLKFKCDRNGIELRVANRFYPSSKTCNCCGTIKKDLKLSDRIFKCNCGYEKGRDLNAALNLRDAKIYKIA